MESGSGGPGGKERRNVETTRKELKSKGSDRYYDKARIQIPRRKKEEENEKNPTDQI